MDLAGPVGDIQHRSQGLGKPGRRYEEVDCSAWLAANGPESREKTHHTDPPCCHAPVNHCGTSLLADNGVRSLVAHGID